MKAKKLIAGLLSAALLFSLTSNFPSAAAASVFAGGGAGGYYYDQLNDLARIIYEGIGEMDLRTGTAEYDLVGHGLDGASLPGNAELTTAMNAARYAYYADHPEVFYVDFPKLALRTTQDQSGGKHVYIGSGRNASYLIDAFSNAAEVESAIDEFNARVDEIAAGAEEESGQAAQIKYVHNEIISNVSYRLEDTAAKGNAPLLGTPYGVLVRKQGVCEGYARAFKTVMDRLGINCILVQGVHQYDGEAAVGHMWNDVEITDTDEAFAARAGGRWYAVDATLDDPEIPIISDSAQIMEDFNYYNHFDEYGDDGFEQEKYLLAGQLTMNERHFEEEEVIAAGGYHFSYPLLDDYDFTVTDVSNDLDGFQVITKDVFDGTSGQTITEFRFNYLGMTATEAREQGIYLLMRYYREEDGEILPYYGEYGSWFYLDPDAYAMKEEGGFVCVQEGNTPYIEIAATTTPPSETFPMSLTYLGDDSSLIARTGKLYNQNRTGYVPPPFILRQTPTQTSTIAVSNRFYHITVEYDERLELADGYTSEEDIRTKITCWSRLGADVTGDQYSEIKNFRWDGDRIVEFDMKFSLMYADDNVIYNVCLEGLVGETSKKTPNPISYSVRQKMPCPSVMKRDGNWDIFGKPTLLESDDLSLRDWETSNGRQVSDLLKDRLTLVTTKTTGKQNEQIAEQVKNGIDDEIISSATYNITLSVCKSMVIETGHKVKVRLGFPEGYGPNDEGVTFKAYHFMRDNQGNVTGVEEIDCVVTQYGLIITCDSFSPFMVAVVESDGTAAADKTVVVTTSDGGTVSGDGLDASGIVRLSEGGSQTVTFTARDGYQIESVTVCGREIEVTDNQTVTVTVGSGDVRNANNIVNANFVAQAVVERDMAEGREPVKEAAEPAQIEMPAGRSVPEGGTLAIEPSVAEQAGSVQTFQWYKDGVKLEGRIGRTLEIRNAAAADAGKYTLVVTTTVGTVSTESRSAECVVTVGSCTHAETEVRGRREPTAAEAGYTGDIYCRVCGQLVERGTEIPKLSGGGSGGYTPGSGSDTSGSDSDTSDSGGYTVRVDSGRHGTVSVSPRSAGKGSTVTVTVRPDDGYELEELLVLDRNGNALSLTKKSGTQYTFTMPSGAVTVEASFAARTASDGGPSFADVPKSAYYCDAVAWAVAQGITNGTTDTTFSPNASCTRAQIVTFLWRAAGAPSAASGNPFTDLRTDAYYYDAVLWAVEQGITLGTSANTFTPDATVTRAQTVTFLHRAKGSPASSGSSFADVSADAYYADAVAWARAEGITAGTEGNAFSPDANCTRGQIVTFLYRGAQ